jgi:hypothetical protein
MKREAKCAGNGCPIRETCDRFVRPAVDRQTWLEPTWQKVMPSWGGVFGAKWGGFYACMDRVEIAVQPHGGAVEEGDGA